MNTRKHYITGLFGCVNENKTVPACFMVSARTFNLQSVQVAPEPLIRKAGKCRAGTPHSPS